MRASVFVFLVALLGVMTVTAPAVRSAEGEDPHCGTLQAEQLQLTRQVKVLKSDITDSIKAIAEDRKTIAAMEDAAQQAGLSRTGNVTSQTRYYKDRIAGSERDIAVNQQRLRAAEARLAYVQGRQRVYNCMLSFDLSGEWILTWTWSVTSVDFAGNVSGGGSHWTFTGTLSGGGNAVWSPKKGSGTVNCTLSGKMGGQGTIQCTASFTDPQPSTWTGAASGSLEAMSSPGKRNFEFMGRYGRGTSTGQPPAGIDVLQLQPKD